MNTYNISKVFYNNSGVIWRAVENMGGIIDWNAKIKAYNGNRSMIRVAHWNSGSSHLGRSSKGREKLAQIQFLLEKHEVDILGVSEANLGKDICDYEVSINGYNLLE